MYQNNISIIKKRAGVLQKIVWLILAFVILFLLSNFIIGITSLFASPEKFNMAKDTKFSVYYQINDALTLGTQLPYNTETPFSIKLAYIICMFSRVIIHIPIRLYVVKLIADILGSIAKDATPFIMNNVKRLKKIAYAIIIYSIVPDIVLSLLFWIFVTKIFFIHLYTIKLNGILIGVLILLIVELIKYGVFLQDEFDSTL